ncbi:hypothetical protein FRB99_006273 [Tulasnella sp. 403]|nr:hypothetical protein FRB99_006273 [Tulasnella sp. 403]
MQLTIAHLLLASLAAVNYIPTVNALPFELAHGSNAGPARVAAVGNLRRRTQVNVFEILIDDRGRARETRTFHSFPQPTNYYPEFDLSIQQNNIVAIDASGSNDNSFDGSNDHNNNDDNNFSGSNVFDKIKSFFK